MQQWHCRCGSSALSLAPILRSVAACPASDPAPANRNRRFAPTAWSAQRRQPLRLYPDKQPCLVLNNTILQRKGRGQGGLCNSLLTSTLERPHVQMPPSHRLVNKAKLVTCELGQTQQEEGYGGRDQETRTDLPGIAVRKKLIQSRLQQRPHSLERRAAGKRDERASILR
jgi:hypothetical protein